MLSNKKTVFGHLTEKGNWILLQNLIQDGVTCAASQVNTIILFIDVLDLWAVVLFKI